MKRAAWLLALGALVNCGGSNVSTNVNTYEQSSSSSSETSSSSSSSSSEASSSSSESASSSSSIPISIPPPIAIIAWASDDPYVEGFKIYRSWTGVHFIEAADVAADVREWTDSAVTYGSPYWWYVTAYNSEGESEPSDTVKKDFL